MASLQEFLEVLADAYPDEQVRGKEFEPFLRDALLASPSHQFADVWLWDDWPGRDGPERGIDLVAEDLDGGLWGIQSKLYGPDGSLNWGKLSTWVAATRDEPWVQRLLVSNVSKLSRNAEKELLDDPKTRLLLGEDLFDLRVAWPDSLTGSAVRSDPLDPRPHQVEAIEAICDGFNGGAARLQVHMACGTGKTFTALWAYQRLAPDLAVVLVPSLSLMEKEIREWTANTTIRFRYLPVCSDVKVAEDERSSEDPDLTVGDLSVLDAPATTDVDTIARFLRLDEPRVVFCTYQSSDVLADACAIADVRFGLVVADEAHRTTGRASSVFATVLDDDRFPADRRLFMTGTPRTFTAAKDDDETVQSMDDTDTYGEVAYRLGFGEAVDLGLLANYEVFVVAVEDPDLREKFLAGGSVELAGLERRVNVSALVSLEGALRAVDEFDMSRLLSFHSRIKGAADWASAIPAFQKWRGHGWAAEADTVNGKMNASERKRKIGWLEKATDKPRLLTNARCLSEGIDVPSLDGIVFANPRRSQVDIVQAIGRVMRKDPKRSDKVGRIVIPLVVPDPDSVDGDDVFKHSAFKPIWDVLRALKAHDFRLEAELNRLRGLTVLGPVAYKEFLEATHLRVVGIEDLDKFQLAILEKTTSNFWWWLKGPLAQFVEREGHARVPDGHEEPFQGKDFRLDWWVIHRRGEFRNGKLSEDRFAALDVVRGWEWDPLEADFQKGLGALAQFVEREGHARVPDGYEEPFQGEDFLLGSWVAQKRRSHNAGRLSDGHFMALEETGFDWDPFATDFARGLAVLEQYVEREGDARVPDGHEEPFQGEDFPLGTWVQARRTARRGRKDRPGTEMPEKQVVELDALGFLWDAMETKYQRNLAALRQYIEAEGHTRVPPNHEEPFEGKMLKLGSVVQEWRKHRRSGSERMTPQRIADLDALGFDWDPAETDYQRWLAALRQFVAQEGHASPVVTHVETLNGEKFTLGTWVANQRLRRRNGRMPPQEAATLETFPGWVWDPHATAFQKGLGSLAQFVEREGHARVAEGHVELFEGAEVQLGTWVSNRRQDFRAGELSAERITVLEAFPGWVWDPHATDFQEGLAVLGQFVGQEGHARVAQSHVESFEGAEFSLGSWVSNRRRDFKAGKLSAERIDALEAFPGWEWNPGEKRR